MRVTVTLDTVVLPMAISQRFKSHGVRIALAVVAVSALMLDACGSVVEKPTGEDGSTAGTGGSVGAGGAVDAATSAAGGAPAGAGGASVISTSAMTNTRTGKFGSRDRVGVKESGRAL